MLAYMLWLEGERFLCKALIIEAWSGKVGQPVH